MTPTARRHVDPKWRVKLNRDFLWVVFVSLGVASVVGLIFGNIAWAVIHSYGEPSYEDRDTRCDHEDYRIVCYDKATGEEVCRYERGNGPSYNCRWGRPR